MIADPADWSIPPDWRADVARDVAKEHGLSDRGGAMWLWMRELTLAGKDFECWPPPLTLAELWAQRERP